MTAFQYLKGGCGKEGDRLFRGVCCDRTRGNGFKLREGRFCMDVRKRFFCFSFCFFFYRRGDEALEQREVVEVPSLQTFKVGLDQALSNLM